MSWSGLIKLVVASAAIAACARFSFQKIERDHHDRLTSELCTMVGNYLETGALQEAYEGLSAGLANLRVPSDCVTVIDNGRSYSPECQATGALSHNISCRATGNTGVRAEVRLLGSPFFDVSFFTLFLLIAVCGYFLLSVGKLMTIGLVERVHREIQLRLFGKPIENPGRLAAITDWVLKKTGLLTAVHNQVQTYESQLESSEAKIREQAALRIKNEVELERANQFAEHVGQIKHDIASPLSALIAAKDSLSDADDLFHETLACAIRSVQFLLDDLDMLSTGEDSTELTISEVVAEEVVALLRHKFYSAKEVDILIDYDPSRLSPVMVNPHRLRRILHNLLENSFEAVVLHGRIKVSVLSDQAVCKITVEDNGCGISKEALAGLFKKGATFGKINGTGLGLYDSKKSVESWQGEIECEPLAQGTRFTISLPLVQVGVSYVGLPTTNRVVVIDDDPTVAKALSAADYQVLASALTFEEGKRLLAQTHGANTTILVDQRLDQGKLGTDLVAESSRRPSVILCTNDYNDEDVVHRARQVGLRILPKPLCFIAQPQPKMVRLATIS